VSNETTAVLWPILLLLMAAGGVLFGWAGGSRAGLQRWARTNGYRLVASERRYLEGPFPDHNPRGTGIFYVTVEDRDGRVRHGYVRCSIGISGLLFDEATVRWDD